MCWYCRKSQNKMSDQAYYITIAELAARGRDKIPSPLRSSSHLIYSSPAALAFNSPGAEGFGVKKAGLAVPGSVMLIVSPGCCGRNTSLVSHMPEYENRFFYLTLDESDVITGRHLDKIPQAAKEITDILVPKPSVLMICITCVDALLGTDMERVCRKAEEFAGIPVRPCYMYALTREGSRPPMVHVRQTLYSLLEPMQRKKESANILGYFSPLDENCELYALLESAGIQNIREISTCGEYDEFLKMSEANFNLLLNPEGRLAANDLTEKLGIPYIELTRIYDIERSEKQYIALSKALGFNFKTDDFREAAIQARQEFCGNYKGLRLGIGECLNADSFELALAMVHAGLNVSEIYGTVTAENFVWIRALARLSPETKVFSNLEPTMLYYEDDDSDVEFALGKDACYYHTGKPGLSWNSDIQPFGFSAAEALFKAMNAEMNAKISLNSKLRTESEPDCPVQTKNRTDCRIHIKKAPDGSTAAKTQRSGVKSLRKILTPFAPDQSGAVSVLYELGGIIVILDAGGCAGNICGFDEPRWTCRKSAVFSAGLRDMDAIMGSDTRLVQKITDAASKIRANFIALIGTPVPAMTATDYHALKKKLEQECGLPVLTIDTNGMELYDRGAEKAWTAVFDEFAKERSDIIPGKINIIGETPQDTIFLKETGINSDPSYKTPTADCSLPYNPDPAQLSGEIRNCSLKLPENPAQTYPGISALTLDDIKKAAEAELNIVTSPSAVRAAKLLEERFGTPYKIVCPNAGKILPDMNFSGKDILIVHQHVFAGTLRKELYRRGAENVTCASWFMMPAEIRQDKDVFLKEESDFTSLVKDGAFDILIADNALIPLAGNWRGLWIDAPHFALSGSTKPAGQVQRIGPGESPDTPSKLSAGRYTYA